jgi:cell division protein FtsZ
VSANVQEDDDFIIKPVTRMSKADKDITDIEVVSDYIEEEKQITLTFDLPLSSNDKVEKEEDQVTSFQLDEDVKKISVNDYVELIPVNETTEKGDMRYALEDYMEVESSMNKKQAKTKEMVEEFDQEVIFEKKVVKAPVQEETSEEIDPMNSPISELLKERAEERRLKMKDFNYKFNNAKIDDIERVPAYKRQGVNLDEAKHSSETDLSRSSVGFDDNDDIQIRSNNSFLHDNVD